MSKRYSVYHLEKLRRLLEDMLHDGVLTYDTAMGYADSVSYAYPLVPTPDGNDINATQAYVNLRFHATHPGAIFANDAYTRAGVEMAVQALEREAFGGADRAKRGRRKK